MQYFFSDFKIVPIAIGMQDYDTVKEVAAELIRVLEGYDKSVVIVASSDFTHYEDVDVAKKKDTDAHQGHRAPRRTRLLR